MNIFVGCGATAPKNPEYLKAAEDLGAFIVKTGHNLVYGGCNRSMMGAVQAEVAKDRANCKIFIATCKAYYEDVKNLKHDGVLTFDTVNQRKDMFHKLSDMLIYLPGGIGTFDEFFSALESKKNGEHNYPIIILNINGYFDPMIAMINKAIEEGFVGPNIKERFTVFPDVAEFKKYFYETYIYPYK